MSAAQLVALLVIRTSFKCTHAWIAERGRVKVEPFLETYIAIIMFCKEIGVTKYSITLDAR
jgi:hypothetical protein